MFGFVDSLAIVRTLVEGGSASFILERNKTDTLGTGLALTATTIRWQLTAVPGSSADPTVDFVEVSGIVQFQAGEIRRSFQITSQNDTLPEVQHAFILQLVSPSGDGRVCGFPCPLQQRTIVIEANDDPHGVVAFLSTTAVISLDAGGTRVVTAQLGRSAGVVGAVNVVVQGAYSGTPGAAGAFQQDSVTTAFATGSNETTVTLRVQDTAMFTTAETITLNITAVQVNGVFGDGASSSVATIGTPRIATATIPFNAAVGEVAIAPTSRPLVLTEPENGTVVVTVPVVRTGGSYSNVSVAWLINLVSGSNSVDDGDFASRTGSARLTQGQTRNDIAIQISVRADLLPEFNESFTLTLVRIDSGAATLSTAADQTVPGVILQNDSPYGEVALDTPTAVVEEGSFVQILLERTGGTLDTSLWSWQLQAAPGTTASAAVQFTSVRGLMSFVSGATSAPIILQAVNDAVPELNQTFVLTVAPLGGFEDLGTPNSTWVTILESDYPYGQFGFENAASAHVESPSGATPTPVTLTVLRLNSSGAFGFAVLEYTVTASPLSLAPVTDLYPTSGTLTFAEGVRTATITLYVRQDNISEADEDFVVGIFAPAGSLASVAPALSSTTVTVLQNDDPIRFDTTSRAVSAYPNATSSVMLNLTRGGDARGTATVAFAVTSYTPSQPDAFVAPSTSRVTFADGSRLAQIVVQLALDSAAHPDRVFVVRITETPQVGAGFIPDATSLATVTVRTTNGRAPGGDTIYAGGSYSFNDSVSTALTVSEETGMISIPVVRTGGLFSTASLFWQVQSECASGMSLLCCRCWDYLAVCCLSNAG